MVDPHFDPAYHLRYVSAGGAGTWRDLLDMAAPITMQGFDRARPQWEMYVVEGLEDGKAAILQKIHHAITDGVGGIEIALMLLDSERESGPDTSEMPPAPDPEPYEPGSLMLENIIFEQGRLLPERSPRRLIGSGRAVRSRGHRAQGRPDPALCAAHDGAGVRAAQSRCSSPAPCPAGSTPWRHRCPS